MKSFKVSVVMPNINGKTIMEKNLPKLFEAVNNPKNNIIEVIIVDDGSWDDSVKFLSTEYKDKVKLIKHTKNRGFSAAVNTGVRATSGDLILLINTDVIPEKNFLESVVPHFEDPKVFAVSTHETGYGGAKGFWADGYIQLGMNEETKSVHQSFYVSGGSGVFRKSIWQELGGMDEKLLSPFYWEDIDLCYRATKRGYINLWEPNGKVVHQHESTISKFPKKYVARVKERNQLLMLWKNIHSKNLIKKHIPAIILRALRHPGYFLIIFMALGRLNIALKARKKEIKECKVSDEAIFANYKFTPTPKQSIKK
ncbi:MAG: Glycosyl transferase, family 2 [Candidatus Woesebacteria bacterium GW2011_GWA1_33_30]|uniref:Glycosyl transferase, family 2 n=1 Tax=Candidatus Woesebacteria bacterium GW2011_GWA2_33_28 TaxID=1618561 RepID=A0A0G0CY31_9BACT|nr:MAG: Glycosyl transferase, family 2 [Candidatus Woesebacteria bacterium GW2011_GWA2_33_28]KKP49054.1 MAG: Glycosyl transferase, family 2 [Candidatus Woesebacteria bacterium GW2011_GWA1_33_30]KKP49838.1 MAG: Glycosyl transferase, family 2 [Microgenomates group bacterium GW2011_GWC1_33_32]KKP52646.1 MAG: Glycosyl transferase, family 2 [Candidatus Woesebacteria bacterium GW2011_GWB1_33_38]KKP58823.1 MAG: Glycosyl transferase, family 2 [Microgenomates group bacterium GW2011_GWD1_33_9]